jgi:hypothetical protein
VNSGPLADPVVVRDKAQAVHLRGGHNELVGWIYVKPGSFQGRANSS